ncbi:MAG: hypothetical protein GY765_09055 [bacterium]|nr:hypothetical protein [bacterium]
MKGVIVVCLAELIKEKFGKGKWEDALEMAGLKRTSFFMLSANIDDATVMKVVNCVCRVLKITLAQAADAFGDYWVNDYAPRIYKAYYRGKNSAKEFLMDMDNVHITVTKKVEGSAPPRFEYELQEDNVLVMTYKSSRGLIDFFVGLVKGVGRYFNEDLKVRKIDSTKVKITFPA